MDLQAFTTVEEKKNAFEYEQVGSFKDAIDRLTNVATNGAYFRGLADGSWKLYSSMQREWITRELWHRFNGSYSNIVSEFLNYVYENNSIQLRRHCKVVTDISVFSVLQHYGAPTPFVDWTSDWKVALYFASDTNGLCFGNETSSFVSVYWLNVGEGASTPNNDLTSFSQMLEQYRSSIETIAISNNDYAEATKFDKWKNLDALWMEESDDEFMKISNPRADLQNGAFVYSKEKEKSLDKIFSGKKFTDDYSESGGTLIIDPSDSFDVSKLTKIPQDVINTPNEAPLYLPKIHCLDIHKSLVPQIKKYLSDRGISKKSLGLDSDDWGKDAFQSFLCRDSEDFFLDVDDKNSSSEGDC